MIELSDKSFVEAERDHESGTVKVSIWSENQGTTCFLTDAQARALAVEITSSLKKEQ